MNGDNRKVFKGGTEVRFPQTFVFEVEEGQLTRLQAYAPYPPPDAAAGEVA